MMKMEKIATPLTFDAVHGTIMSVDEKEEIKRSVKTILMTSVHERITSPSFGSRIQDYVFTMMEYTNLEMIKKEVMMTLSEQESRIQDIQVSFEHNKKQEGVLLVYVSYELCKTYESDAVTLQYHQDGVTV